MTTMPPPERARDDVGRLPGAGAHRQGRTTRRVPYRGAVGSGAMRPAVRHLAGSPVRHREPVRQAVTLPLDAALDELRVALPERTPAQQPEPSTVSVKNTRGVVAVVPAHNEEDGIADILTDLQAQTVAPDRILVIVNNSTDRTLEIAQSFDGVDVVDLPNNPDKKVGALIHAWQVVGDDQPYWFGVDADTRLDPHCLEQLLDEIDADKRIGGVMARYTFDQKLGRGLLGSLLVFAQRLEFAGWIDDLLHRGRRTYVLGGQASLFRTEALQQVAALGDRTSPWTTATLVEDMELSWQLEQAGYDAYVSTSARAYAGPMTAVRGLWGQRSKWDYGLAKLLWDRRGIRPDPITAYPWRLQAKMLLDFSLRAMFALLMFAAWVLHAFTWYWIWIIPPIWASLLNIRLAMRLPRRRLVDIALAGTLIVPELYLMLRLVSWARCWLKVVRRRSFDGWTAQYQAELKAGRKALR